MRERWADIADTADNESDGDEDTDHRKLPARRVERPASPQNPPPFFAAPPGTQPVGREPETSQARASADDGSTASENTGGGGAN
jgi:hypothetical protein